MKLVAFLLAVMLALASPVFADCTRLAPLARYGERVVLAEAGETVRIEVNIRNADSCECEPSCFTMSYAYHPPHDGSPGLRIGRTRIRTAENTFHPPWVCLAPGEEHQLFLHMSVSKYQDAPGFVTPSLFFDREHATGDFCVDRFDCEGTAICYGYTYHQCKDKAYEPAPPDLTCPQE